MYGKEFTLAELCRIYGQPRSTVAERLKKGIPIDDAIKKGGRNKLNNKLLELSDTLKLLKERKSELDAEAKKIEEEIDGVTTEMIGIMTTEELTSFKRDGPTSWPSPPQTRTVGCDALERIRRPFQHKQQDVVGNGQRTYDRKRRSLARMVGRAHQDSGKEQYPHDQV